MSGLRWALATERAAGMGGAFTDVLNRALRDLLSQSGYNPDATTFPGLSGPVYNVLAFGADGTGVAASDTAVASAITAAPAGSTILFPAGLSFKFTAAITVNKALTFQMTGATLSQVTANTGLFVGTVSDCSWFGGKLIGPQFASQHDAERAISVTGTSAAAPATNITVHGVSMDTWGGYGVFLKWVTDFDVTRNKITNIWYAAIGCTSCFRGTVGGNRINNVVGTPNAYGIFLSRESVVSLVTDPRSMDITCTGNVVIGVVNWEGIDTHGGQGITIANNRVYGCFVGIAVVPSSNGTGPTYAPLDVTVAGNSIASGVTDGSKDYGIAFVGANASLGTPVELATGSITGNTIRGHGAQAIVSDGAIYLHDTRGIVVTGNSIIEPSPHGINLANDNYGFVVSGNTIVDQWSTSYCCPSAIVVSSDFNSGRCDGNHDVAGSKSATNVRVFGIRISASLPNTSVVIGNNSFAAAATPYSIATAAAVVGGVHASPLQIGASGTAISQVKVYTPTLTPASVAAATVAEQTFGVAGLAVGDKVVVNPPAISNATGLAGARVSAAGTLAIRFSNPTAGALTPTSGVFTILVFT